MAISSLDQAIAGRKPPIWFETTTQLPYNLGSWVSNWPSIGVPGKGEVSTTLNGNVCTSSTIGGHPNFVNPTGGQNSYLLSFNVASTQTTLTAFLCDRLWHNGNIDRTITSTQSITSPTWPARDANGETDGVGVLLALEVNVQTSGSNSPVITVEYTNSDGVGSRTATSEYATQGTMYIGTFIPLTLQGTDKGVRSVQSITLSSTWTAGTINLVAYRIIAPATVTSGGGGGFTDAVATGFPRIYDDSCLFLTKLQLQNNNSTRILGTVVITQG